MMSILIATFNPMLLLFFCIALGFVLHKTHLLPAQLPKLEKSYAAMKNQHSQK